MLGEDTHHVRVPKVCPGHSAKRPIRPRPPRLSRPGAQSLPSGCDAAEWVKTSRPFSSRMRAIVIVLSPIQAALSRAAVKLKMRPQDGVIKFIFVEVTNRSSAVHLIALLSNHRAVVRG